VKKEGFLMRVHYAVYPSYSYSQEKKLLLGRLFSCVCELEEEEISSFITFFSGVNVTK
jgi:hypothetical protein